MSRKTIGQVDTQNVLITLAVAVGGYIFVVKPILVKLGILPDEVERIQSAADKESAAAQAALTKETGGTRSYNDAVLKGIAVQIRLSTKNWYGYDYHLLVSQLAYFAGFRAADARYFLGIFVKNNGYTLFQWWVDKFQDAGNYERFDYWGNIVWLTGTGGTGTNFDYRKHFQAYGLTENSPKDPDWDTVVKMAVDYVYLVAGVSAT